MYGKKYGTFPSNVTRHMKGNKLDKYNWEILRSIHCQNKYAIEKDKARYVLNVKKNKEYHLRVKVIQKIIKKLQCDNVVSLGIGCGVLEYMLKENLPHTRIICTDYTYETLKILEMVSNCDEFKEFDILNGNYNQFEDGTCLLMHRVSTEFSMFEWKRIFQKIYNSNKISYVIFIPAENGTVKEIIYEKIRHIKNKLHNVKDFECGWLYTKMSLIDFMTVCRKKKHVIKKIIPIDNTAIYLIKIDSN